VGGWCDALGAGFNSQARKVERLSLPHPVALHTRPNAPLFFISQTKALKTKEIYNSAPIPHTP